MQKFIVKNAKGEIIRLTNQERMMAEVNQAEVNQKCGRYLNSLGLQIDITTLTTIVKEITEQKFFHIAPADYIPLRVGNGAWGTDLLTYRSFLLGEDFETGNLNDGSDNSRLAVADTGVDSISVKIKNWAKTVGYNIIQLAQAQKAGNWDLVQAKERSRKENWDLGIQKIAFLGSDSDPTVLGLYTQSGITENTALISGPISLMAYPDFNNLISQLVAVYRQNNNQTAWPDIFVIPESDYVGLASATNPEFPIKTKLEYLEMMLKQICMKPDFKVLPCAYGNASKQSDGKMRYALYRKDPTSLRMDIPVDYTSTLANSLNGFTFQNVGYGQYTGVMAYRPAELLYLSCAAPDSSGNW